MVAYLFFPSLCSGSILPDYTGADVFCFHNIICEWVALTRGHSGAFVVLSAFAHLYIKMHLLTVSYWSIEYIHFILLYVFCILPIIVILGSWWWGPLILLPRVQRSVNLALVLGKTSSFIQPPSNIKAIHSASHRQEALWHKNISRTTNIR